MSKINIVFGSQGSGKSTYAKGLAQEINGVHFSIDDWIWSLYGGDMPEPINFNWVMERVSRCEKQIWATAKQIAVCGGSVILDLGFLKVKSRNHYLFLAQQHNLAIQLHYVTAPRPVRWKRITQRNTEKGDTFSFHVTPAMFEFMENEFEPPTEAELSQCIIVETSAH